MSRYTRLRSNRLTEAVHRKSPYFAHMTERGGGIQRAQDVARIHADSQAAAAREPEREASKKAVAKGEGV